MQDSIKSEIIHQCLQELSDDQGALGSRHRRGDAGVRVMHVHLDGVATPVSTYARSRDVR